MTPETESNHDNHDGPVGEDPLADLIRPFTIPREVAKTVIKSLMDTLWHIEVSGAENVPETGGAILICNHTDFIDVPVQAVYVPRKVMFLAKKELFQPEVAIKNLLFKDDSPLAQMGMAFLKPVVEGALGLFGSLQRSYLYEWGGHPIARNFKGDSAKEAVEYYKLLEDQMVDLLKEGHLLSVFPEGTITKTGVMNPFKALPAKLAVRAGVPIIPSGISGSFQVLTTQSFFSGKMFKAAIQYNIGAPIDTKIYQEMDEKRAAKELTALLEEQVYALSTHPERRSQGRGSPIKTKARTL